ncbi:MAG TPA: tRNA (guanosine(37)-N1)-methyltransferase TrmD [Gammaproteobacteria bacterium]|nr:tRNA (guanosine(37)-N1)-methyltransferase TrmD [Gammaproteobacteria bacterium]
MTTQLDIGVISLFPQMFEALRAGGVTARALDSRVLTLEVWNPRDFTADRHRTVDDRPYGGGPGMVMLVEPLKRAIESARAALGADAHRVLLSPQGRRMNQGDVAALAERKRLVLVCGRYEGVDERLVESVIDEELSLGDFVLSGGEIAAMAVIDAVARLLPGVLGHEDSAREDSFADGLLDCPHYSRPESVDGRRVPQVLLSGDHAAIRRWRLKQALGRTYSRRPELLEGRILSPEQRALLEEYLAERDERAG